MSADLVKSFNVAATLASQRIVTHNTGTAFGVKYPAAALEQPVGVSIDTVLDVSGAIPIQCNGVAKILFNDTCASGALVAADSSGRGVPFVDATAGAAYIGTLVDAAVGATGTVAKVLINPGYKAIP